MPFIQILGYNVFDPNEVNPEFTADFGAKKGKKRFAGLSLSDTGNTTVVQLRLEVAHILIPLRSNFDKNYSAA